MRLSTLLLIFTGLVPQVQTPNPASFAQPIPMPDDRARDSYAIYSQLLQQGPIEWRDAPRKQWFLEKTTTATPLDQTCQPYDSPRTSNNPHYSVKPPVNRQEEWDEVLADYDEHCHDRIQLDRNNFKTELPIRLLSDEDKELFMKDPQKPPAEFADGAGLHQFTQVFFNEKHTLALLQQGMWCGGLCGNWTWVPLERKGNRWQILPWPTSSVMA